MAFESAGSLLHDQLLPPVLLIVFKLIVFKRALVPMPASYSQHLTKDEAVRRSAEQI